MSDHLIPVTAAQLARLPGGVLVQLADGRRVRWEPQHILADERAWLDLSDTVTRAVVAACVVRPWSELRKALKFLFGRDARIGEAAVESWEVEEGDHGPLDCLVDHATGRARRHLPAAWLVGHATRRGAVRAPYWHPGLQEWVAGVGDLVQLRPEVLEIVGAMKLPPRR